MLREHHVSLANSSAASILIYLVLFIELIVNKRRMLSLCPLLRLRQSSIVVARVLVCGICDTVTGVLDCIPVLFSPAALLAAISRLFRRSFVRIEYLQYGPKRDVPRGSFDSGST